MKLSDLDFDDRRFQQGMKRIRKQAPGRGAIEEIRRLALMFDGKDRVLMERVADVMEDLRDVLRTEGDE